MLKPPFYSFLIAHEEHCQVARFRQTGAVLSDLLYRKVCRLCEAREDWPHNPITLGVHDPRSKVIFEWLATEGITPRFQSRIEANDQQRSFTVETFWRPTPKQLANAEYFQITTLGRDLSDIGTLLGMDSDHLAHISANSEQWRRPTELAELRERLFVVSDQFRQRAEMAGLVGLKLNDITWYFQAKGHGWDEVDPIEDPRGRRWMASNVCMPPCLTPRRYTEGPEVGMIVTEKAPEHCHIYDSEGLAPSILRFSRTAVEKLGVFDVAVTRECTHRTKEYVGPNDPAAFRDADYWLPDVIVSRRFKDWFAKSGLHGCRSAEFRIVELV